MSNNKLSTEGEKINPEELNLVCNVGAIGVHDLYESFGVSISYEKADFLWLDFCQDIYFVSLEDFPSEKINKDINFRELLFLKLYLFENKIMTTFSQEECVEEVYSLLKKREISDIMIKLAENIDT